MYGTRDAAQNWFEEYSQGLLGVGFQQGKATPYVFYHEERGTRPYVHGDDYVSIGIAKNLEWMKQQLEARYQVKTQTLGPDEGQSKEVKIFNRIVTWCSSEGFIYEEDPRHIELIIEQLNIKDAKPVTTPGTKEEGRTQPGCENKLNSNDSIKYRATVARCNHFSPDRPDIAYIAKELARKMSEPTEGDWQRLKRFGRYLKGKLRLQHVYKWQEKQLVLKVFSDVDWAGCKESRKSTTGRVYQNRGAYHKGLVEDTIIDSAQLRLI